MARREVTGRKPGVSTITTGAVQMAEKPLPPKLALSIQAFCDAHSISEDFYYKLKRQGQNPREMKVGARTLISIEAAADWRKARENVEA